MNENNHYPDIRQAVWLLVTAFVFMALLGLAVGIIDSEVDFDLAEHPVTNAIINLIVIGAVLIWGFRKTDEPFMRVFPLVPVRISLFLPMTLIIIGGGILFSEFDNIFRVLLPAPKGLLDFFIDLGSGQTSMWGSIVLLVLIAPLSEELLFRGLIMHGFLSHYSVRKSILFSSLLFGLFHLNPWQLLPTIILGVLFAWWFVRTRSLLPCLFGHALNNAMPLIWMGIFHIDIEGFTRRPTQGIVEFQPLWLDMIGLVVAGLGIWLLVRMFGNTGEIYNDNSTTIQSQ